MEYIMISMLTISIFTYIVYMLANKILAVQMHIKFLILCAFCAFSISLILPRMLFASAGLAGTLCIVILFGIISSYFIARYYDSELQKEPFKNTSVAVAMEIPMTIELPQQDFLQSLSTLSNLENVLNTTQEVTEDLSLMTESITKEYFYPVRYREEEEEHDEKWELVSAETLVQLSNWNNIPIPAEIGVSEYFYPIKYREGIISSFIKKLTAMKQQEKSEELLIIPAKNNEEMEIFNHLMYVKNEETEEIKVEHQEISMTQENLPIETSNLEIIPEEISSNELHPSSTDLDILMDLAFLQKEQRNFIQALNTFRRALFLYPDSEVSPFLAIEIGTILKNLGSYNEAIKVFTEGRLLPGVINNTNLDQEFINNIAYLRVVKNILIKNSLEFTPLKQISSSALKEIDDEFCEWRSQS